MIHKSIRFAFSLLCLFFAITTSLYAQTQQSKPKRILIDVAHGQKFWNDPDRMEGMDLNFRERIKYITGQIKNTASSVNAEIGYVTTEIKANDLSKSDLLFIHMPSTKYTESEIKAITNYLKKGGSLFLVMDVDYWSTLQQTNVNDMITPFGIQFGHDSADTLSGGYTQQSAITEQKLKVTYHGARTLKGGTPFCFNNQSAEPFGTFAQIPKGGKIVAMGDGMVSLYMTSWKGVEDYQCSEFMHEVFAWLLKK